MYVKELDIFLTMKVLEDTPAALSLGKPCDEHGCSHEWMNAQKPHLIKDGILIQYNTENFFRSWFLVCQRVLPEDCLLQHPRHLQRKLIIQITFQQSCQVKVSGGQERGDPHSSVTNDSATRTREDLCGMDSCPVSVSRTERRDPLTKPTKSPKPNKNEGHESER